MDRLLDSIVAKGGFYMIDDFAYPLPVPIICRLLGFPLDDEPESSRASTLVFQQLGPFTGFTGKPFNSMEKRLQAGRWLRENFRGLIERH
ncbi:hypothetical protein [Mycobacterium uberis]|uniref:hypothetical protein n=1 Tax=Mycobacterium uberis TaxID=2162698 RepID=UPI0010589D83|nr:hypothetical protein [Mycobacterium uberis]